jgi:hypothetical protein
MFREDFGNMDVLEKLVKKRLDGIDLPGIIKIELLRIDERPYPLPNVIYLTTYPRTNGSQYLALGSILYGKIMPLIRVVGEDPEKWDVRVIYDVNENMKNEKFPFSQVEKDGKKIRTFKKDVDTEELVWHRDREDRLVEVLEGDGWELQLDNELPKKMKPGDTFIIPEGVYHRVKRGNDDLKIAITFL